MDWNDSCNNMFKNIDKNMLFKKEDSDRKFKIEIPFHLLQFLSSEGSNIQNVCRICLSVQQKMICLFTSQNLPLTLPSMLASLSSIQAQPGDGLPPQICDVCEAQVVSCYNFKLKCENSEHTLRSLLIGEITAQDSESNPKENEHDINDFDNLIEDKDATTIYSFETSDKSTCTTFDEDIKHVIEDTKEEIEIHEDIQYLEALSDHASDEEPLRIVQNIKSSKSKTHLNLNENNIFYHRERKYSAQLNSISVSETKTDMEFSGAEDFCS